MGFDTFRGAARRLDDVDIPRIAARIGCGEDHLHAVMEVETRGGGFDHHGRPRMLFEPHVFYRQLDGADRARAEAAGLAYPKWGERPYPSDSYPRLRRAMEINEEAALRSASWGLGQVMGFNHRMVGYDSAADMVADFLDDEETHLEAMVEFIVAAGLDDDLRREDWAGFARGYNGAGYAQHDYHGRLRRAFERWRAIPDTPTGHRIDRAAADDPNPPREPVLETRGRTLRRGMRGGDIRLLQETLRDLGHFAGSVDGIFGERTEAAILAFQRRAGIATDGVVGPETWVALEETGPAPERDVTEDDLRRSGSRTIAGADGADAAAGGALAIPFVAEAIRVAQEARGVVEWAAEFFGEHWWAILGAGVLFLVVLRMTARVRAARVEDARTGRNMGR